MCKIGTIIDDNWEKQENLLHKHVTGTERQD